MRQEQGFSVIECLFVVLLVVVLAAIAVPNLVKAHRSYQLNSAAQQVVQVFQITRIEAQRTNSSLTITINATDNTLTSGGGNVMELPAGVSFGTLPSEIAVPASIQSGAALAASLPNQHSNAYSAVSFPAGTPATLHTLTVSSRGLPDVEPGVVNWIYLVNQDAERIAIVFTSSGSASIFRLRGNTWGT